MMPSISPQIVQAMLAARQPKRSLSVGPNYPGQDMTSQFLGSAPASAPPYQPRPMPQAPEQRNPFGGGDLAMGAIAAILSALGVIKEQDAAGFAGGWLNARQNAEAMRFGNERAKYEQDYGAWETEQESQRAENERRWKEMFAERGHEMDLTRDELNREGRMDLAGFNQGAQSQRQTQRLSENKIQAAMRFLQAARDRGESVEQQAAILRQLGITMDDLDADPNLAARLLGERIETEGVRRDNIRANTGLTNERMKGVGIDNQWKPKLNQSRLDNDANMRENRDASTSQRERGLGIQQQNADTSRFNAEVGAVTKGSTARDKAIDREVKELDRRINIQKARLREKNISRDLKMRLEVDIKRLEAARDRLFGSYQEIPPDNPFMIGQISSTPGQTGKNAKKPK